MIQEPQTRLALIAALLNHAAQSSTPEDSEDYLDYALKVAEGCPLGSGQEVGELLGDEGFNILRSHWNEDHA